MALLTYNDFIELVPKETKIFVDRVLVLFDFYINKGRVLKLSDQDTIDGEYPKKLLLLLLTIYNFGTTGQTKLMLAEADFNPAKIKIPSEAYIRENIDFVGVFNKTADIFCPFKYKPDYMFLTPEAIVRAFSKSCINNNSKLYGVSSVFDSNINNFYSFYNKYEKQVDLLEKELRSKMKMDFFQDLPFETIDYLEKMAKVTRMIFDAKQNESCNQDVIFGLRDIRSCALLIALNFIENNATLSLFEEKGLKKEDYLKFLKLDITQSKVASAEFYVTVLLQYYQDIIFGGKNEGLKHEEITVDKIIRNLFNRKLNGSIAFEKILKNSGLSYDSFQNLDAEVAQFREKVETQKQQKQLKEFYGLLPYKTIDFIEQTSKIHVLIRKALNEKKANIKYISNEDDITALSFFISSYLFTNEFVYYFKDNGISYDEVIKTLGLENIKESIKDTQIDFGVILNQYRKFIFQNFNNNVKHETITPTRILANLANRDVTRTMTVEELVRHLNPSLSINNNFWDLICKHNVVREENRQRHIAEKLFGDMHPHTIEFLERASSVYQWIKTSNVINKYSNDDVVELTILITLLRFYNTDLVSYLKTIFYTERIWKVLNLNSNNNLDSYPVNIDIIANNFGKYIFSGYNEGKAKSEIKIEGIFKNIINKSFNSSVALAKFLYQIDSSYEEFEEVEVGLAQYKAEQRKERIIANFRNDHVRYYIENVVRIYKVLAKADATKELSDKDRKFWSLVLGIFTVNINQLTLLQKRGFSVGDFLDVLGLCEEEFSLYNAILVDYDLIEKEFESLYYQNHRSAYLSDIYSNIFSGAYGDERILRHIASKHKADYETVVKEMGTGEEIVKKLSKEEQLQVFAESSVANIGQQYEEIALFGNELSLHSNMIVQEFSDFMALRAMDNNRISDVKAEIDRVTRKPEKKQNFIQRIFGGVQEEPGTIEYNREVLDRLNNYLVDKAESLEEGIAHYQYLKKLIALYIYRELEHLKVAEAEAKAFNASVLNKQYSDYDLSVHDDQLKQTILNHKVNNFRKSLIVMMQEYQKVNMLAGTHAAHISEISLAKDTMLPALYIEMALNDGIIKEKESFNSLSYISGLLDNMMQVNAQGMNENITQLASQVGVGTTIELDDNAKARINSIIADQDILNLVSTTHIEEPEVGTPKGK